MRPSRVNGPRRRSPWRERAIAVIQEVLEQLPPDADEQTRRKALRAAYPFGERRFWPYKMWLLEVRLALRGRLTFPEEEATVVERLADGRVRCGWCRNRGCLACFNARHQGGTWNVTC